MDNKNKYDLNENMTNSEKLSYVLNRYEKEFEIKNNIEQKAGLLLTAIGLFISVLLINIFSNNLTRFTKDGILTSVEFVHILKFDINLILSIIITAVIIDKFIIKSTMNISLNSLTIIFSLIYTLFPSILIYIFIFARNDLNIINFNEKKILFFIMIFMLLYSILNLLNVLKNKNYHMVEFYNTKDDLINISECYTYKMIMTDLMDYTKKNVIQNIYKTESYNKSLIAFYLVIICTILYLI